MALKPISPIDDNSKDLGLKISGDLGDLQISTSSDDEDTEEENEICARNVDSLSNFPSSLLHSSKAPVFGNVAVSNSENVQLGNNTHFHGPVTIKQIIQSKSGVENVSYISCDEETAPPEDPKPTAKSQVSPTKKYHIQLWHKVVVTATCVIVVAVVFTLVFLQGKTSKSQNSSSNRQSDTSSTTVVGLWYDYAALITFPIVLVVLIIQLMLYPLLIPHMTDSNEQSNRTSESIIPDTSQFVDNRMRIVPKGNILIAPNHLRIVSRTDWLAQPPDDPDLDKLRQPVPWVIIAHTATENCYSQTECVLRVRLIQMFHMESRKWDDIGYNFLIGGDGSAYYGRGWDIQGAHTLGYNKYSIGIGFVGTFNNESPAENQLDACKKLLQLGVQLGKLTKDYKLFAHRQLSSTLSPGDKLYNIIKTWPHFVNDTSDVSSLIPDY